MTPPALALALAAPPQSRGADLEPLRRRMARAGGGSTEAVLVDFLEDDLREAQDAVGRLQDYLTRLEAALRDGRAGPERLLEAAQDDDGAVEGLDELTGTLASAQRRVAQLAARMKS